MENLRKIISVRLFSNGKRLFKTCQQNFIFQKIFDKSFAVIHEIKPVLKSNKPIYVGFTVLELSKWLMYDFHYNFIKKNVGANLLLSDTDSLTYEIKSEDVYEEFFKHKHLFEFSEYQSNFLIEVTKKLLAK